MAVSRQIMAYFRKCARPRRASVETSFHSSGRRAMSQTRITASFLNIGHAVDHLMMLIFPTVVLAMTASFGSDYRAMLPLSLGGFLAFGAGSLPAGWLGDHWGRRPMMIVFFVGVGVAGILASPSRPCQRARWPIWPAGVPPLPCPARSRS